MSADNGLLVWRDTSGMFRLSEYCASVDYDEETGADMTPLGSFSTLKQVVEAAERFQRENIVEYGVSFALDSARPPLREGGEQ